MNRETKKVLKDYVVDQKIDSSGVKIIKDFCETQPPISNIFYRGHKRSREIRFNKNWFSATEDKHVAKNEFASSDCCVFTIHLVNIPTIYVNKFIGEEIGHYKEEKECIFLGGGKFYKDKTTTTEGFHEKKPGEFECWYKLPIIEEKPEIRHSTETSVEKNIFQLIPIDEYDFIDSPEDIIFPEHNLTSEQKKKYLIW